MVHVSGIKRFLEDVSIKHGYGGEINSHVMELAKEEMGNLIDQAEYEVELQRDREIDEQERNQEGSPEDSIQGGN